MYNTLKPTEGNSNSQLAKAAREIVEANRAEAKRIQDEKLEAINKAQASTRERIAKQRAEHEAEIQRVADARAEARLERMKASARRAWRGKDADFEDAWTNKGLKEEVIKMATIEEMKRENEAITAQSRAAQAIFNSNQ